VTATPPTRIDHVRIDRGRDNAFAGLSQEQRLRLIVQVLCGLVAYEDAPDPSAIPRDEASTGDLTDRLAS
jgi:hypothetical protein